MSQEIYWEKKGSIEKVVKEKAESIIQDKQKLVPEEYVEITKIVNNRYEYNPLNFVPTPQSPNYNPTLSMKEMLAAGILTGVIFLSPIIYDFISNINKIAK